MFFDLFEDKKTKDMAFSLGLALLMIIIILLPKFCFRVSPE